MPETNIDFEGNETVDNNNTVSVNTDGNLANQPDSTAITGDGTTDVTGSTPDNGHIDQSDDNVDTTSNKDGNKTNVTNGNSDTSSTGGLEPGTQVEFDGTTYIISDTGDLVDQNGNVFKKAAEVDSWIKSMDSSDTDTNSPLDINAIKDAIGIDVQDENGNPIEFTNNAEGVVKYINSVISLKSIDLQQGAINKLYSDNPLLKQFVDYVTITGTPRGFGEIPDRSGIQLDKDNANQLEAVIRMAASEFGNKSVNDNYIKYLKDNGALYDEARIQLAALVDKDKAVRAEVERRAETARREEEQQVNAYWQRVSDSIANGNIAGYKLPNTFVKEVNGRKITYTKDDFYDYLAKPAVVGEDGNRLTAYQRDLQALSDEETLDRELIDAWLMFTGGSYKDLVNMAINEEKVRKLVLKSKERKSTHTVKVSKPKQGKVSPDDIIFG